MSVDLDAIAQLAETDSRVARQALDAQRAQAAAEAKIAAADADADRQLRIAEHQQRLDAADREARRRDRADVRTARRKRREELAERRRSRRQARRAHVAAILRYLRTHADDAYAATMYALAVGGAVFGQITAATGRGWPLVSGLVIATAIEGLALVMALTAQKLRLAGEAARAPRALTWICAGAAAGINYLGHASESLVGAILLAALSLAGIIVWEIRSGAAHRVELRARGLLPDPPAAFGWRRWLRFPCSTLAAWSVDVRDRVSPHAARLLEIAATERFQRQSDANRLQVRRLARRAVKTAIRDRSSPAVLAALTRLADHGTIEPVLGPSGPTRTSPFALGPDPHPLGRTPAAGGTRTGPHVPGLTTSTVRSGQPPRRPPWRQQRPGPRLRLRKSGPQPYLNRDDLRSLAPVQDRAEPGRSTDLTAGPYPSEPVLPTSPRDTEPGPGPDLPSRSLWQPGRSSTPDRTATPGPSQDSPLTALALAHGPRRADQRTADLPARRSSAENASRNSPPVPAESTVPKRPVDVADLLRPGKQIRDRLAANGVPLSRSVLIKGLREQNIPVSTDRATALLAVLRRDGSATQAKASRR